jgi:SAM-dependent methyltransferase
MAGPASASPNGATSDQLICDLCGGRVFETVVQSERARAMRSDRMTVDEPLRKAACRRCGLVRSAVRDRDGDVDDLYRELYEGNCGEHTFHAAAGPIGRSAAIADWMLAHTPGALWEGPLAALEVGAGAGLLLRELQHRFPRKRLVGVEPGVGAAAEGRARGSDIRPSLDGVPAADIAWAIAVLEHVPSPTSFLRRIRSCLAPGGMLMLIQPSADVPSYDVLFLDHLHHFGRAHLAAYARKCGFTEVCSTLGHPLMPNFSLHVWRADAGAEPFEWTHPPAVLHCGTSARGVLAAMKRLDRLLERLASERRRVAAFGVREVFALARAYSCLESFPLTCGFDDHPAELAPARFPFPIVPPEAAADFGVTDALLTMNTIYYRQARQRCASLDLVCHPVLEPEPGQ